MTIKYNLKMNLLLDPDAPWPDHVNLSLVVTSFAKHSCPFFLTGPWPPWIFWQNHQYYFAACGKIPESLRPFPLPFMGLLGLLILLLALFKCMSSCKLGLYHFSHLEPSSFYLCKCYYFPRPQFQLDLHLPPRICISQKQGLLSALFTADRECLLKEWMDETGH